jgi:hypothetical protein
VATYVDCLVKTDTWPTHPPKPANCDVDWAPAELSMSGQRVSVGSCRGDIGPLCGPSAPDSCTVLRYGASVTVGRVRCSSAASGVTCRRTDGRHVGFRIAREGYKIYR